MLQKIFSGLIAACLASKTRKSPSSRITGRLWEYANYLRFWMQTVRLMVTDVDFHSDTSEKNFRFKAVHTQIR